MKSLILSLVAFITCSICFGGTINPNVEDSKYIEYGNKHECVTKICGEYPEQNSEGKKVGFIASCVIIKPKIILTAAHVVHNAKNIYIVVNEEKIKVENTVVLKAYNHEAMSCFDIAVCSLEKNATISFYPELYSKDDEVKKICSLSGCGMSGNYKNGAKFHDGKKRAGSNIIDEIWNGMLICSVNKKPYTSLEFLIANGDSGGGLFINQKLAGIHSSIMTHKGGSLNSDLQDQSCHTRISLHKPWIDFVVSELEKGDKNKNISIELFDFL